MKYVHFTIVFVLMVSLLLVISYCCCELCYFVIAYLSIVPEMGDGFDGGYHGIGMFALYILTQQEHNFYQRFGACSFVVMLEVVVIVDIILDTLK